MSPCKGEKFKGILRNKNLAQPTEDLKTFGSLKKKIGVFSVNRDSHLFTNDVELVSFCMEYQYCTAQRISKQAIFKKIVIIIHENLRRRNVEILSKRGFPT